MLKNGKGLGERDFFKSQERVTGTFQIRQQIFLELSNTPYEGTGNPEALKYELSGYWSRRITKKDRIIYKVYEDRVVVLVVSAIGHFSDHSVLPPIMGPDLTCKGYPRNLV